MWSWIHVSNLKISAGGDNLQIEKISLKSNFIEYLDIP
jgi:hypothetical protein